MEFQPADNEEVERILNEISNKATGLDGIFVKMLKIAYSYSHNVLINIVN